eukprot:8484243-Lingulodinium_polyedra.AAC.1
MAQGGKLRPSLGLKWQKAGARSSALVAAAKTAFRGWAHQQLKKLFAVLGVEPVAPADLLADATALVKRAITG